MKANELVKGKKYFIQSHSRYAYFEKISGYFWAGQYIRACYFRDLTGAYIVNDIISDTDDISRWCKKV